MSADYGPATWRAAIAGSFTPTNGRRIDMMVAHSTGGVKAGDLYTLQGKDASHRVSIHTYFSKDGGQYQLVRDKDIAWHAGVSAWQGEQDCGRFSLGFELENLNNGRDGYTDVQLDNAMLWNRAKVRQYEIPQSRYVQHAWIALPKGRRTDPVNFPWAEFVDLVYRPAPGPATVPYVVKDNGVWLRQGPSDDTAQADFGAGPIRFYAGRVLDISEIVTGKQITRGAITSDQWAHWPAGGFVWAPHLERV